MANEGKPAEAPTVELPSDAPDSLEQVLKKVVATNQHSTNLAPGRVIAIASDDRR